MALKVESKIDSDQSNDEEERKEIADLVSKQNKKKKKSGGFQSMGLSHNVFQAVIKKGYRVPTPIQRKTIPLILEGRDIVAMARTGSGKTASFLIPLFEKLKTRSAKSGARALILSPTKELAMQTHKFTKALGRFTDLKATCVLGGESMEKQFALIHENPDIIIATPGRFVHVCVEMNLKLNSVEYVVFDEADRLFEMGFGEQLRETLARLPADRQTLLFSATLPKLLVEFAKAGLSDPSLVRLDVDTKIPDTLQLCFLHCRPEGKLAVLLQLLTQVIPSNEQVVIFCATRHHVEYLHMILNSANIDSTLIYSHLDPTARKINATKFQSNKTRILLVTDLAARGIDIPLLDNVVNFNFPSQSKLFVHRVGRVARAGRRGTAYSLVAGDEMAYFMDLQLFLGQSVKFVDETTTDKNWHNVIGDIPQKIYDDYADQLLSWHSNQFELRDMKEVSERGYTKYLKSRPSASHESIKRVKAIKNRKIHFHPLMVEKNVNEFEKDRLTMLEEMKNFRPSSTVLEIGNTAKSAKIKSVMIGKRSKHENVIERYHKKLAYEKEEAFKNDNNEEVEKETAFLEQSTQDDIESAFGTIVNPKASKKAKVFKKKVKKVSKTKKDEENYIGYTAKDHHTEAGYSLMNNFQSQAHGAVLDLAGDDDTTQKAKKNLMRWDSKKKKYVRNDVNDKKKIKTESGVWIQASYKSDRYKKWKERSKYEHLREANEEEENDGKANFNKQRGFKRTYQGLPSNHPAMKKAKNATPKHKKGPKIEIKRPEQVLKQRKLDAKKRRKNTKKTNRRRK